MKICNAKSDHHFPQKDIFNQWITKAKKLINQGEDELIIFSTLYSALNSAAWYYSAEDQDRKMILDFQNQFYAFAISNNKNLEKRWRVLTDNVIKYTRDSFRNMHKLQKRTNQSPGPVVHFKIKNTNFKLQDIDENSLEAMESFNISSEILYQYRCNLVHGTKSIGLNENIQLAKILNKKLIQIFVLLPKDIIHEENVKDLSAFIK
jgi:hypothetical protein